MTRASSELVHSQEFKEMCQVSVWNTVWHPEWGLLCQWVGKIPHPIEFKDKPAAYKWIVSGCIAEIQEGITNLAVGFYKEK